MSTPIQRRRDYLGAFSGPPSDRQLRREALKCALDIRKFEIDLYWRRATYFWTLIAAAFAGYFVLSAANNRSPELPGLVFLVSCVGFLLSAGWYLVNRGSKFWQENWERHVDMLEDEIMGPLYKTTISKDGFAFWKLWSGYPYSVSKVNQIISLFILVVWLGLAAHAFPHPIFAKCIYLDGYWLLALVTALFTVGLFTLGLTGSQNRPRKINLSRCDLEDSV